MRLLQLRLLAFGHFSNVEIDFAPRGVQVVFGRNEAGKSTTLRAIAGLLYGIPKGTSDAHLHKMPELRIGGVLADEKGQKLDLVRRKGRENTLLDRQSQPIDEALLSRLLGGVGEEQFLTMFGLDHASLRQGGAALLLGEGNVGESLFGAAMAGGELNQVLRSLRTEADALFTPKAHTRPLNEAVRAWTDAHKRTRVESMSHESVEEQQRGLADAKLERHECENDKRRLQTERTKLERATRALPILSKRRVTVERRAALGAVVPLPASAVSLRIEHQGIAGDSAREVARLEEQTAELARRLAALVLPEALISFEELPYDIVNRLGSQRKAMRDLPRIEAEVKESEAQARAALQKMGRNAPLELAEAWRIDAASQATIRRLERALSALDSARQKTRLSILEKSARHASLLERRAALPPCADITSLKKIVSRAEREGPLDHRLAKLEAEASRLTQVVASQKAALGLATLSTIDAIGLSLPSSGTLDRLAREWASIDRQIEQVHDQTTALARRLTALKRDIDTLELAGKVPTEVDLLARRQQRDQSWVELRKGLVKPTAAGRSAKEGLLDRYEAQTREADEIADRLRREAERVSRLAVLVAERLAAETEQGALTARKLELDARRADAQRTYNDIWQGIVVDPAPPAEMKDWLMRHATFVDAAEELSRAQAEISATQTSIASHREPLLAHLEANGVHRPRSSELSLVLDAASELFQKLEAIGIEHQQLAEDSADLKTELDLLLANAREQEADKARLMSEWQAAVAPLGFTESASPEEATAAIECLTEAFQRIDAAESSKRRIASIHRDAQAFAADVEKLTSEHAPDLVGVDSEQAAAKIIERFHVGKARLAERREIERQLNEARSLLGAQRDRQASSESTLSELMTRAGVPSIEALEEAEKRSLEAVRLDEDLARLDTQLLELGGDASSLHAEFEQWDIDSTSARLGDLDTELDQLQERTAVVVHRLLSYEAGLKELDDPEDKAAQAALEAESALARVRDLAERYLTVRVASVVLAREIERYRQENQGPIVARASELFRRLTLGSFGSLKVGFDEKDAPVLLGVRSDGQNELLASAMSDGTRDQLFLALRIATLERYFEHNDPLPLVVDDILVHFDDERARAALEILAELSQRTQVLFFTHHARLVELARRAIDPSRLSVRELGEIPAEPAPAQV